MRHLKRLACTLVCAFISTAGWGSDTVLHTTSNPAIKQGYADSPMGQLHYFTAGSGPALLLIHQSSSSIEEYAGMVPHLAKRFQVIAYDWPGHGLSDDQTYEYGVPEYTDSAVTVLDHLKIESAHVLGNHGGALIAMNLAWKHPERVNKLILSGTSGVKSEEESKKFTTSLDDKLLARVDIEGKTISDAWDRYVGYMPDSSAEEILRPFTNNVLKRARPYDAHYGVLRFDRRPALAAIKNKKILLMQGERDIYVSHQETLLPMLPNARRKVVPKAGVFSFYERPKASAKIIRKFLRK